MKYLIGKISQGGLKMANFVIKNKAIKATWVRRLITDPLREKESLFSKWGGFLLFKCDFSCILLDLSNLPLFYKYVIFSWEDVIQHEPLSHRQICSQIIWNNRYIVIGTSSVYYKTWANAGIIYFNDLLKNDGTFYSITDLHNTYGIEINPCHVLKYNSLKTAIPQKWKEVLKKDRRKCNPENIIHYTDKIDPQTLTCKQIYDILIQKQFVSPGQDNNIIQKIGSDNIENAYTNAFVVTKDTKLQCFQYKILHRYLATNNWLQKVNIKQSNKCNNCNEEHTIEHLFVYCHEVVLFWKHFCTWWKIKTQQDLNIDENLIIYEISKTYRYNKLLHCILIAKYVIYTCFLKDLKPNLKYIKAKIANMPMIDIP